MQGAGKKKNQSFGAQNKRKKLRTASVEQGGPSPWTQLLEKFPNEPVKHNEVNEDHLKPVQVTYPSRILNPPPETITDPNLLCFKSFMDFLVQDDYGEKFVNVWISYVLALTDACDVFYANFKTYHDDICNSSIHRPQSKCLLEDIRLNEDEDISTYVPDIMLIIQKKSYEMMSKFVIWYGMGFDTRNKRWYGVKSETHPSNANPGVMLLSDTPTPYLASCDLHQLMDFHERIKSLHASNVSCDLRRWIVGQDVMDNLYYLLYAERLIQERDEFDTMLDVVALFIEKVSGLFRLIKSPIGDRSLRTRVLEGLRFIITDFLDSSQLQVMIKTWSAFLQTNGNLLAKNDSEEQSNLIQAFIETNMTAKASVGEKKL